jgi:DNA-directed RNA polymerase I and III subunit RPAC2
VRSSQHTPHPTASHRGIDKLSSLTALLSALSDLDDLCETVENAYETSLRIDKYEKWEEKS